MPPGSRSLLVTVSAVLVAACAAFADEVPGYNSRIVVRLAPTLAEAAAAEAAASRDGATGPDEPEPTLTPPPSRATIAGESRLLLAPSGRRLLTLRPTQIATGGRLFVFGKLPADLVGTGPSIEVMLRRESGWKRERIVHADEEVAGPLGFTLVVDDIEPGPVLAAMSARSEQANGALVTVPFEVPAGARLRLGFGFDEWDWKGLAAVTVSVVASVKPVDGTAGEEWEVMRRRLDPARLDPGWFDEDIDLDAFTGDRISLSLRARVDPEPGLLAPEVVWSRPSVVYRDREQALPPSFVVLWADSLRTESLGCCGSERETSPYIDRLFGDQGMIFDHAVAQAADTRAATMSLMTSSYPSSHGVLAATTPLARKAITLAEAMSAAGYATAAFVEGGELAAELGFDRGFDVYYEHPGADPWHTEGHSAGLLARMLDWMSRHEGEPRLAFFHSYDIGWPYLPDPQHAGLFDDERLDRPSSIDQGALVRYEREVRGFDDVMRGFIPRLDEVADPSRTLLLLSSAHGEEFGEHGALRHGAQLYEETLRVPLMLRGLGIRPGSHHRGTIGHIDLAPTILELGGLEVPPSMKGTAIGKALGSGLPFTVPERVAEAHSGPLLRVGGGRDTSWSPPWFALSHGDHKLILGRSGKGKVVAMSYDLLSDPDETNDLLAAAEPPAWATGMLERLRAHAEAVWQREAAAHGPEVRPSSANRSKLEALER